MNTLEIDGLRAGVALDLAEQALAMCHGDHGQVTVDVERSLLHRFASSRLVQATAVDDIRIEVLVVRGDGRGTAVTTDLGSAGLAAAAHAAGQRAELARTADRRASVPLPAFEPAPEPVCSDLGYDAETADLESRAGHAALAVAVDRCDQVRGEAFGLWTSAATGLAVVDSTGLRRFHRRTDARMKCVCRIDDASGFASGVTGSLAGLDPGALAERAAADALAATRVVDIDAADVANWPVVLAPAATAFLLAMLGPLCANGMAQAEGRGAFSGRLGEQVAASGITLVDDARAGATLPRVFDLEGTPTTAVTLIDNGVAAAVVHDRRSAARTGTRSTGHGASAGGDPDGPVAANLALASGAAAGIEALTDGIESGLLITRFWYGDVLDARSTTVTAMTRDAVFAIERGHILGGVEPLRLTDSILSIFGSVDALTVERSLVGEEHLIGRRIGQNGIRTPAVRAHRVGLSAARRA